jgi:hypothetical protein
MIRRTPRVLGRSLCTGTEQLNARQGARASATLTMGPVQPCRVRFMAPRRVTDAPAVLTCRHRLDLVRHEPHVASGETTLAQARVPCHGRPSVNVSRYTKAGRLAERHGRCTPPRPTRAYAAGAEAKSVPFSQDRRVSRRRSTADDLRRPSSSHSVHLRLDRWRSSPE